MPRLLLLNHVILFLCCSIYLGGGIAWMVFQAPLEAQLTPDTYQLILVEPAADAACAFAVLTAVMLATGLVMLLSEWFTGIRWVPLVILAALAASTMLTLSFILPYHEELARGVSDPGRLSYLSARWTDMHRLRVALWAVQWAAMMYWFYRMAWQARADR